MQSIAIIGAGGHAREVREIIDELNLRKATYRFLGYIVSDRGRVGTHDSKNEIIGDFSFFAGSAVDCVAMGIGDPAGKITVLKEIKKKYPRLTWPHLVSPSSRVAASATLEEGAVVFPHCVISVNTRLEAFVCINSSCTVSHEAEIGYCSTINPGSNINGGVKIGRGSYIGTGAQIKQYVTIGDGAVVGAGAVVLKDVQDGLTVVGVPAVPITKRSQVRERKELLQN